jgi:hypothetical protein
MSITVIHLSHAQPYLLDLNPVSSLLLPSPQSPTSSFCLPTIVLVLVLAQHIIPILPYTSLI